MFFTWLIIYQYYLNNKEKKSSEDDLYLIFVSQSHLYHRNQRGIYDWYQPLGK